MKNMIAYIGSTPVGKLSFNGEDQAPSFQWEPMPIINDHPDVIKNVIKNRFISGAHYRGANHLGEKHILVQDDLHLIPEGSEFGAIPESEYLYESAVSRFDGDREIVRDHNGDLFLKITPKGPYANGTSGVNMALSLLARQAIGAGQWGVNHNDEQIELTARIGGRDDVPGDNVSLRLNLLELFGQSHIHKYNVTAEDIASRISSLMDSEKAPKEAKVNALRGLFSALVFDWLTGGKAGIASSSFTFEYVLDGESRGYQFKGDKDAATSGVFAGVKTARGVGMDSFLPYYRPQPWSFNEQDDYEISTTVNGKTHGITAEEFIKFGVSSGCFDSDMDAANAIFDMAANMCITAGSMILSNQRKPASGDRKYAIDSANQYCEFVINRVGQLMVNAPHIKDACGGNYLGENISKIFAGDTSAYIPEDKDINDAIVVANKVANALCVKSVFDIKFPFDSSLTANVFDRYSLFFICHALGPHGKDAEAENNAMEKLNKFFDFMKALSLKDGAFNDAKSPSGDHFLISKCIVSTLSHKHVSSLGLDRVSGPVSEFISGMGISFEKDFKNDDGGIKVGYHAVESPLAMIATVTDLKASEQAKKCLAIFMENGYDPSINIDGLPVKEGVLQCVKASQENCDADVAQVEGYLDQILPANSRKIPSP